MSMLGRQRWAGLHRGPRAGLCGKDCPTVGCRGQPLPYKSESLELSHRCQGTQPPRPTVTSARS